MLHLRRRLREATRKPKSSQGERNPTTNRKGVMQMHETKQAGKVQTQKVKITITIERTDLVKNENKKTACKSCTDCKR